MYPTKHLFILVPATSWFLIFHKFSAAVLFVTNLHYLWYKFSFKIRKIDEPSNCAIWGKFSKQHQHQNIKIKKAPYKMLN